MKDYSKDNAHTKMWALLLLCLFLVCCQEKKIPTDPIKTALIDKGKSVYMTTCIACHNPDPKISGSIGPEVYGSSKVLIESKIVSGEYPPNYVPKRKTKLMPKFAEEHGKDIEAIHAFLNQ